MPFHLGAYNAMFPVLCFSFSFRMPATRPSTRIQRRAQSTAPRSPTCRRLASNSVTQRQAASVINSHGATPMATTSKDGASTPSPLMNNKTLQCIVAAVSQAVLSSMNGAGIPNNPPPAHSEVPTTELAHLFLLFVCHPWGLFLKRLLGNIA